MMMGDVSDTLDVPISRLTNGKTIKATSLGKAATVPPIVSHGVFFRGFAYVLVRRERISTVIVATIEHLARCATYPLRFALYICFSGAHSTIAEMKEYFGHFVRSRKQK